MPFTQAYLNDVRRRHIAQVRDEPPRTCFSNGDGVMVRRIPQAAYINAVRSEGVGVLGPGGEGYWKDMEKWHPEIVVPFQSRHPGIKAVGAKAVEPQAPDGRWIRQGGAIIKRYPKVV